MKKGAWTKTAPLLELMAVAGTAVLFALKVDAQNSGRQFLHGHVPAAVTRLHLQPLGRFPATNRLNLAIGLPLRNQQALNNLLQQIYDPASSNCHHYLTPEQFTERYGPSERDYQAVIAFVESKGLKVTHRHSNRVVLDVSGPVADIEKTIHARMQVYQHPTEARTFYAPDVEPSLDLTIPILHISGLDNYAVPHPANLKIKPAGQKANAAPNSSSGLGSSFSGSGPGNTYMGKDFQALYAPNVMLNGSGQSVGLLEFDGYYTNDITMYEGQAELPPVTLTNVPIDGGVTTIGGDNVEVALDIEMVISMAPNVSQVLVYEAPNPSPWEDILSQMADDNLAKQLSCSWYQPGGGPDPTADQIFQQMAAQGQSFFSASGDGDAYTGLIDFPSDNPYITVVGGTMFGGFGQSRGYHTATLLSNGQVLVAGGVNSADVLSSALLYDPTTGGWTPTGSLNIARAWHTATLLTNGQVLVVGGGTQSAIIPDVELYDPATGKWTPTGSMTDARESFTATLLPNGQVLVAGGDSHDGILSSAELYDPVTGTWTPTGSMTVPRYFHTATLLANGLVLVAGGGIGASYYSSAELYNPATGTWTPTGSMNDARMEPTATLLANGQVLVAGGNGTNYQPLATAELYNPATGTWTLTPPRTKSGAISMIEGCYSDTATLLSNGQVLVAGGVGFGSGENILSSAQLYDPTSGKWLPTGAMNDERWDFAATLLTNGLVLVEGSWGHWPILPISSAELYNPATGTWTNTTAMGNPTGSTSAETTWNEDQVDGIGSGGGISTDYPIPSWQTNINMTTNGGSTTMRNVPDVAMLAFNVYAIYNNGTGWFLSGTSCAAPLWAGFIALVNQQAMAAGRPPVGFINPAVYAIGLGTNYTADFHDIATGDNTWSGSPTNFYAVPGYDLCTGWGTPAGQGLINDLSGVPGIGILVVTPTNGFTATGPFGGPFDVTTQNFILTNSGPAALVWTLANNSSWIDASPSSGLLIAGVWTNITVSLDPTVTNMTAGNYAASMVFTQLDSGNAQSCQFDLFVVAPPSFRSITQSGGTVALGWAALEGLQYQVQYCTNIAQGAWINCGGPIAATNTVMIFSDVIGTDQERFYRVQWVPPH